MLTKEDEEEFKALEGQKLVSVAVSEIDDICLKFDNGVSVEIIGDPSSWVYVKFTENK